MCRTLRRNFTPTSSWTLLSHQSQYTYLRMRYTPYMDYSHSTKINSYVMHSSQYCHTIYDIQAPKHDDTLRIILAELDGVPNLGNDELKDARDTAVTLELTNRFAHVRGVFCLLTLMITCLLEI